MDLVLRPINDQFFQERVLPFLVQSMADSAAALQRLQEQLADEPARLLCEQLLNSHTGGGLGGVEQEPWAELVDRLTFQQWGQGRGGWQVQGARAGYAGSWDDALHLALMLEDEGYPYADGRAARQRRDGFRLRPEGGKGVASLMCGHWEPFPAFPPDRVFTTLGRGEYTPRQGFAFADWAWRPASAVSQWEHEVSRKLRRLLDRERKRLAPVELPEREEVLSWWLGLCARPPPLTVAFSGLGQQATTWVQELGVLTGHLRKAAQEGAALVSLVTKGFSSRL